MSKKPEKSNDTLKLLQDAKSSLKLTFSQRKQEHSDHLALADKARDGMLRIEGAIQQVDIFIEQFKKNDNEETENKVKRQLQGKS